MTANPLKALASTCIENEIVNFWVNVYGIKEQKTQQNPEFCYSARKKINCVYRGRSIKVKPKLKQNKITQVLTRHQVRKFEKQKLKHKIKRILELNLFFY